jgi:hypothetical protein
MTDPQSKPLPPLADSVIETDDRRSEPRFQASGEVILRLPSPSQIAIPGRILDISQHGMRIEHMYPALSSGAVLEIVFNGEARMARNVWNRIKDDGVESGFYLL